MYKVKVENLHCMSCVRNIEDALKEFDHNLAVKADVKEKILNIDTKISFEEMKKLIEENGYRVELL